MSRVKSRGSQQLKLICVAGGVGTRRKTRNSMVVERNGNWHQMSLGNQQQGLSCSLPYGIDQTQ